MPGRLSREVGEGRMTGYSTYRVILSTGIGRLHLVQSAQWLLRANVDLTVIQGWVPVLPVCMLNWIGRVIQRPNFAPGMLKRRPVELKGRIVCCATAEITHQLLLRLASCSHGLLSSSRTSRLACQCFGWLSIRHLHDAQIFHVRSSVGQGGAIKTARRRGMKVLVDHSAAHSAFTAEILKSESVKYGFPNRMSPGDPFWSLILKDCDDGDLLLVNSDFVKETFEAQGYPGEKIRVAYLGVRSDFFAIKTPKGPHMINESVKHRIVSPIRLLYTGAFYALKGCAYLLEAMKILGERKIDYQLTVVGSASGKNAYLAPYQGIELNVQFAGHVPQEALKRYLIEADIFVFPSLADGCASSGMEAMAAGLCVVATRESGLPITHGETGYIVPAKNAGAIADRVEWLALNPHAIERTGRAASLLIQNSYTWEKYAERVKGIYDELLLQR